MLKRQFPLKLFAFLSVFVFSVHNLQAIDVCYPESNHTITFDATTDQTTTITLSLPTLESGKSESFYIKADLPGTLEVNATSPADKIKLSLSENECPLGADTGKISVTSDDSKAFDVNVVAFATKDSYYSLTVTFIPASLTMDKTVYPSQVVSGTPTDVNFTLEVANVSTGAVGGIHITDNLPAGVTYKNPLPPTDSIDAGSDWNCGSSTASTVSCSYSGTLGVGATAPPIVVHTSVNITKNTENTATVTGADIEPHSDTVNIYAVDGTKPVDLEIVKFAKPKDLPINTEFFYYIFVINHDASATADLLTVTDTFPAGVDYNQSGSGGNGWICGPLVGGQFTCEYEKPLEGKTITYFPVRAKTTVPDIYHNEATVEAMNPLTNNPDHNTTAYADINVTTDGGPGGGGAEGPYTQGGYIEVSDLSLLSTERQFSEIHTKVAGRSGETLQVYYLDDDDGTGVPTSYEGGEPGNIIPLTVLLRLADANCSIGSQRRIDWNENDVAAVFEKSDISAPAGLNAQASPNSPTPFRWRNLAQGNSRLVMKYMNINEVLDLTGVSCPNSSLSGNIKGLPQCITNSGDQNKFDTNKYIALFGYDTFIRCYEENGQPCVSEHHGYGDAPYDHEYGCYECTLGSIGFCSWDNFGLRPDRFDANITEDDWFAANSDTPLEFNAYVDEADISTTAYNEVQNTSFNVDINISDAGKQCPDMSLLLSPLVTFFNGTVSDEYNLSNVGYFDFTVHENNGSEFAVVDANDSDPDFNDSERFITPFTRHVYVIPDHFNIEGNLTDRGPDFTYLSNFLKYNHPADRNMSALLKLRVTAVDKYEDTLSNYIGTCYAYDTNLTLGLQTPGDTNLSRLHPALKKLLVYDMIENDPSKVKSYDLNNTPLFGSGSYFIIQNDPDFFRKAVAPPDVNGSARVEYRLNFDRRADKAGLVNPIVLNINDLNITEDVAPPAIPFTPAEGNYTVPATSNKAHFYYGRLHAPRYRVQGDSSDITLYYEVYCSPVGDSSGLPLRQCDVRKHQATILPGRLLSVDDIHWYVNEQHDVQYGDINKSAGDDGINERTGVADEISTIVPPGGSANPPYEIFTMEYSQDKGYPFKATMRMSTDHWLLYHPFDANATANDFELEFNTEGGWVGKSPANISVESNASANTNRRISW